MHSNGLSRLACLACLAGVAVRPARAQTDEPASGSPDPRPDGDDPFAVRSSRGPAIDAGVLVGFPAALTTGLSTGAAAGIAQPYRDHVAYGARVSWSSDTESSQVWRVTQSDLRLRATGALSQAVGRGSFAVRLGVGATLVHEVRDRTGGERAGLTGGALQTRALELLPAADLDAVVALHVAGPWLVMVSVGPSIDLLDDAAHWAWTSQLGLAWQP